MKNCEKKVKIFDNFKKIWKFKKIKKSVNLKKIFSDRFNIPIIEGVTAAAALVENLSKQGLKIKKFTKPLTRSNRLKI